VGKVINNTFWILSASAFNKASSIILVLVLSRYLGAADFGRFSFAFFYVTLFSAIAEAGITPVLIRRLKTEPGLSGEIFLKGIIMGLSSTLLTVAILVLCAFAFGFDGGMTTLIIIAALGLFISFRDTTFRWFLEVPFRAGLRMRVPALLGMGSELLGLLGVMSAVWLGKGVEAVLAIYVLSNLPGFALLAVMSRQQARPCRGSKVSFGSVLKEAFPIGTANTINTAYLMLGPLALYFFGSMEDMGYYALAFRITTSVRIIPEALMHSVFPLIAASRGAQQAVLFSRSFGAVSLIALPLAIGTMAAADPIAVILGGAGFAPSGGAIKVLIWATAFAFLNTCARFTFNAVELGRLNLVSSVGMLAVSAGIAFTLIPAWGLAGAPWSLAAAEGFGLLVNIVLLSHKGLDLPIGFITRCMAAAGCMLACVYFFPNALLQVVLGLAAYGTAASLMTGLRPAEILRQITGR